MILGSDHTFLFFVYMFDSIADTIALDLREGNFRMVGSPDIMLFMVASFNHCFSCREDSCAGFEIVGATEKTEVYTKAWHDALEKTLDHGAYAESMDLININV